MPFEQKLDIDSKNKLAIFSKKLTSSHGYTILSLRDVSHGKAKRYSANILLSKEFTKFEMIEIIKEITTELKSREYYSNKQRKQYWQGQKTHVIWLFLYCSLDDLSKTEWICRTQYISQDLPLEFCPTKFDGELIDDNIIVDWNNDYGEISSLLKHYELTKENYLDAMNNILEPVKITINQIIQAVNDYDMKKINESQFLAIMSDFEIKLTKLYYELNDLGIAPVECSDLSQQFQNVVAIGHNIVIPFSEQGLKTWAKENREYLLREAIKKYQKELTKLEFELEKIN